MTRTEFIDKWLGAYYDENHRNLMLEDLDSVIKESTNVTFITLPDFDEPPAPTFVSTVPPYTTS